MAAKQRGVVVGCGGMGQGWMKNVVANPRSELVGVVDIRAEAAAKAAAEHGLPPEQAFTDVAAAIRACKPDFIADITIPEAHCPTTLCALGLGVPVIGEKPLADSMAAAKRMREASQHSGKLYMVSQSRRYDTNHISLAKALHANAIGDITTINCDFYIGAHFGGFRDEMASPLILDMAIHHFDMCRYFIGAEATAVYAHEFNPKRSWYKGDVAATVIFEMGRGIVFTYRGSWCAEGCPTSWNGDWRVIGTEGTLIMEGDRFPHGQRHKSGGKPGFHAEMEEAVVPRIETNGVGIHGSLNEFLDALERGASATRQPPQCEVHDNIHSLAMVFAAMESSRARARLPMTS
jgi:predicted dehydrogenase